MTMDKYSTTDPPRVDAPILFCPHCGAKGGMPCRNLGGDNLAEGEVHHERAELMKARK